MSAPLDREQRLEVLVQASGSPGNYEAYIAAGAALHGLAKRYPEFLGMDVADIYKAITQRLETAIRASIADVAP